MITPLLALLALAQNAPATGQPAFGYELQGGVRWMRLHDVAIRSAGGALALGSRFGDFAALLGPDLSFGSTSAGLFVSAVRLQILVDYALHPLSVGASLTCGYLGIARVTQDDSLWTITLGGALRATLEIVEIEGGNIFVATQARIEAPNGSIAFTVSVGWRH